MIIILKKFNNHEHDMKIRLSINFIEHNANLISTVEIFTFL